MSHRWKITIIVVAVAAIVTTPLVWLLGSPDAAQLACASVQAATGIVALLWAMRSGPSAHTPARDEVHRSGAAKARDGGHANTGIKRPGGRGDGSAIVKDTGPSTAHGPGSTADSGINYS